MACVRRPWRNVTDELDKARRGESYVARSVDIVACVWVLWRA